MTLEQQIANQRNEIAQLKKLVRIGRHGSDYAAMLVRHRQNLKLLLERRAGHTCKPEGDDDCHRQCQCGRWFFKTGAGYWQLMSEQ